MTGYYTNLGVVSTCNGGLYKPDRTQYWGWTDLEALLCNEMYHFKNAQTVLKRVNDTMRLHISYVKESFGIEFPNPRLQPVITRLRQIQRAVRDWLYKRNPGWRLEACLALSRTNLPDELVQMIMRPQAQQKNK